MERSEQIRLTVQLLRSLLTRMETEFDDIEPDERLRLIDEIAHTESVLRRLRELAAPETGESK
jgi:hypothetical protein